MSSMEARRIVRDTVMAHLKPPSGVGPLTSWMTSCLAHYSFGLHHSHNITVVELEEARLNQALRSPHLVASHNLDLCRQYREAWEGALKGRNLVVKATGSFYEMISLPLVAPRKLPPEKPPKPKPSDEVEWHIDVCVGGKWVRSIHDIETFHDKIMEIMESGTSYRGGCTAGASTQATHANDQDRVTACDGKNPEETTESEDEGTEGEDLTAGASKPDIDMMLVDLDKKLRHLTEEGSDDVYALIQPSEHPGFLYLLHPKSQERIPTDVLRSIYNVDDARAIAILCFSKMNTTQMLPKITSISNQGPAVTLEFNIAGLEVKFTDSMDVVRSLYCPTWPPGARRWDDKPYRWPDRKLADRIIADGCHIVAVPHPSNKENRFEHRFSFSHAEVLLTKSLVEGLATKKEHTQARLFAYMVVKLIVKFFVKRASPEIKSYYAKTTLYWYLEFESNPQEAGFIWTHADKIFQRLQYYFEMNNLPNYCIPANNMIKHVGDEDCKLIANAIQKVRDDPIGVLLKIHRDIVLLGIELNEDISSGMIRVLQELGFTPRQRPHLSILNTAYGALHDAISAKRDVNQRLWEFLHGSLAVALCRVQSEPKIICLPPLLDAHAIFQIFPSFCSKCKQEISVVDLMFLVLLEGLSVAPDSSATSATSLTAAIGDLLQVAACYGFDDSDHFLLPSVSRLQSYLSKPQHQAEWYRWCAVVSFFLAVKEHSRNEATQEVDSVNNGSEASANLTGIGDSTKDKEAYPRINEDEVNGDSATRHKGSLQKADKDESQEVDNGNISSHDSAPRDNEASPNVDKEKVTSKDLSDPSMPEKTKDKKASQKVAEDEVTSQEPCKPQTDQKQDTTPDNSGPTEDLEQQGQSSDVSTIVDLSNLVNGMILTNGHASTTQPPTTATGDPDLSAAMNPASTQAIPPPEPPSVDANNSQENTPDPNARDPASPEAISPPQPPSLDNTSPKENATHDSPYSPTNFLDARIMFEKAIEFTHVSRSFSTACKLELALWSLSNGDEQAARNLVRSLSVEDLKEYNTVVESHPPVRNKCLRKVLLLRPCKRMDDVVAALQSLTQDIHNVHVDWNLFGGISSVSKPSSKSQEHRSCNCL